ncbi:alpha/beta fold hydrolase [Pelagibacterium lentulum]|uniref:3-oxoadipate enol-lactonase n=1 Tax=Pelagibacterium lentulum TaxID=2029865 RepID=A0A916R8G7_9HYPH|nr:alpha/beta hydrolase [Pelagibacterium lentulum]GGA41794.1 3-oxoadipate enol-lactonase [Pelagibacterium lentulum]
MDAHTARFERHIAASDGVDLTWLDYGNEDGEAVVLCHGLAAGADQFDSDARYFAQAGYRVIVPDLRGHGRSGKAAPENAKSYSIARMGRDLLDIFDATGVRKVHYAGNSLGGILALYLIKDHPHRFATLTLFGTSPILRLPGKSGHLIPLGYKLAGAELAGKVAAVATTPNKKARPMIERLVKAFDPEVGKAIALSVARYDLLPNLLTFREPVQILRGDKDRAVNLALDPALKRLTHMPNLTVVEIRNAGHCVNLDQPDIFRTQLLEFWSARPDQPAGRAVMIAGPKR